MFLLSMLCLIFQSSPESWEVDEDGSSGVCTDVGFVEEGIVDGVHFSIKKTQLIHQTVNIYLFYAFSILWYFYAKSV